MVNLPSILVVNTLICPALIHKGWAPSPVKGEGQDEDYYSQIASQKLICLISKENFELNFRLISTARLNALLRLHLLPILDYRF